MKRNTIYNGYKYVIADKDNFDSYEPYVQKVGKLEDLLEKYEIKNIEELETVLMHHFRKDIEQDTKKIKLSEIIKVLKEAGFTKCFVESKLEPYDKYDKKLREHIEIWDGILCVKIIDIWNGKIESIDLNASKPVFSKIFQWASIQANVINDLNMDEFSL